MSMTDNGKIAANYMGALAHVFSGAAGRHREFIDKVEIILSGFEPDTVLLLRFAEEVQRTGRPVIWIQHTEHAPNVPDVGLVASLHGKVLIEECTLYLSPLLGRVQLIPQNFRMGAFHFDDDLQLSHTAEAPSGTFEAAEDNIVDAYVWLRKVEAEQRERGDTFDLPSSVPLKKAA